MLDWTSMKFLCYSVSDGMVCFVLLLSAFHLQIKMLQIFLQNSLNVHTQCSVYCIYNAMDEDISSLDICIRRIHKWKHHSSLVLERTINTFSCQKGEVDYLIILPLSLGILELRMNCSAVYILGKHRIFLKHVRVLCCLGCLKCKT